MDSLPYDVLIDAFGVWYGPAGTEPKSRDWQLWEDVAAFFDIICRPSFVLNIHSWRVHVPAYLSEGHVKRGTR